jgi:hypothetical protein
MGGNKCKEIHQLYSTKQVLEHQWCLPQLLQSDSVAQGKWLLLVENLCSVILLALLALVVLQVERDEDGYWRRHDDKYLTIEKKGIRAVLSPTKFADDETKEKQ